MVDLMSVEGGPAGGASPAKLIAGLVAFFCILLAAVALVVSFTLPSTISCHEDDTKYYVGIVDKPTLVSVTPKFACLAQDPRAITFTGTGFYTYNANPPNVTVSYMNESAEFSATLEGTGNDLGIWRQEVLVHTVAVAQLKFPTTQPIKPKLTFEQPIPEVDSAHFASQVPTYVASGCTVSTEDFVALPPPIVEFVQPRLMCLGSKQQVVIGGRYITFLSGGTAAPTSASVPTAGEATTTVDASATTAAETTAEPTTVVRKRQATDAPSTTSVVDSTGTAPADSETTTTAAAFTGTPVTLAIVGGDKELGSGKVSLGAGTGSDFVGTECEVAELTSDVQLCTQATAVVDVSLSNTAAGKLSPFVVTNPEPVGCSSQNFEVAIVERAKIDKMEPFVVFAENGDVPVKLTGNGFLRFDGAVPSVRFQRAFRMVGKADDAPVLVNASAVIFEPANVTLSDCTPVTGVAAGIESCKVLEFVVSANTQLLDTVDLIVTQPAPLDALCGASIETALLPSPKIDMPTLGRYMVCAGELATYKINGLFYRIGGADPRLLFNGEFVADSEFNSGVAVGPQFHVGAQFITAYSSITLRSGPGLLLGSKTPLTPSVTIDIAGQVPGLSVPGLQSYNRTVVVVPNMFTTVAPFPGLCAMTGNEDIEFRGAWFITNSGTPPSFELDNTATGFNVTTVGTCQQIHGPYSACPGVRVSVPVTSRGVVQLRGPGDFSTCTLKLPVELTRVSRAVANSVVEPSICVGSGNQNVTLRGSFPLVGDAVPNIALNTVVFGGGRCVTAESVTNCTEMSVPIDPEIAAANALQIGFSNIAVTVRVSATCSSSAMSSSLVGLPTGTIVSVSPSRICGTKNAALVITGQSLIKNGTVQSIELSYGAAGATAQRQAILPADVAGNCTMSGGASLCTSASVTLPSTMLSTYLSGNTEVPLEMSLITKGNCRSPPAAFATVVPLPTLTSVKIAVNASSPTTDGPACVDQSYVVYVNGANFVTSKQVRVDFRHTSGAVTTFIDGQAGVSAMINRITIPLARSALLVGSHTVTVSNGGSCDSMPLTFVVDPVVNVIITEPRALPQGLAQSFLLRNTGVLRTVGNQVTFGLGSTSGAVASQTLEDTSVIQCNFPSLPAPGNYTFTIRTDTFCTGTSATALLEILPQSAKVPITTDTLFFAGGELVVRSAGVTFAPATRLYLRNNGSMMQIEEVPFTHVIEGGNAVRGFHEAFDNAAAFEIFFVDPTNRRWGSAPFATTVNVGTANAVVPGTVAKSTASASQNVTVRVSDPAIVPTSCTLLCFGTAARTQTCTPFAGVPNTGLGGLLTVAFERSMLVEGEVCRVRILSANSDVTSQPFAVVPEAAIASAATIDTQPNVLKTARSGACAATAETVPRNGAPPRTYVHVIGGRNAGNTLRSVEVALVSATSSRLDFTPSSDLVTATAQCAATTYNGYVYAMGSGIVQRARILSAVDAPTLLMYVSYAGTPRPAAATGTFSYAVAYTTAADGDSLPSNIGEVFVPAAAANVRLTFSAPSGQVVTGWKVYRSKDGGALQLLESISATATTYLDDGTRMTTASSPLAPGAVGKWQSQAQSLAAAVGGAAFTNVQVGTDPTSAVLVGGMGGGTTVANLVETQTGYLMTPGVPNSLNQSLSDAVFVRFADGFDLTSGLESELWTVFGAAGAFGAEPRYEPLFTETVTPTVYNFAGTSCGAAGAGKLLFVGGSESRVRSATYERNPMSPKYAVIGAVANLGGSLMVAHDNRPACARVAGKLLVLGGVGAASSTVTTLVV